MCSIAAQCAEDNSTLPPSGLLIREDVCYAAEAVLLRSDAAREDLLLVAECVSMSRVEGMDGDQSEEW